MSTLASNVTTCSLTCNASYCNLVILLSNSCCLACTRPALAMRVVLSYITTLCTSRDSITIEYHTCELFSSTSCTSLIICCIQVQRAVAYTYQNECGLMDDTLVSLRLTVVVTSMLPSLFVFSSFPLEGSLDLFSVESPPPMRIVAN